MNIKKKSGNPFNQNSNNNREINGHQFNTYMKNFIFASSETVANN